MFEAFRGRRIRPYRLAAQFAALAFLLSTLVGVGPFGTSAYLRNMFLPNASCRYIDAAPTYCYYYTLQDGLAAGASTFYVDVVVMLLIVLALILLLGRVWCSWLCPFGLAQELIGDARDRTNVPPKRLRWSHLLVLSRFKYAILFFTVLISASIGISSLGLAGQQTTLALPFCQVCPAKGFFTVAQQGVGLLSWKTALPMVAVGMLLFFLASAVLVKMFWCRVCPMGAVMALLAGKSQVWLKKDPAKCTRCRVCLRVCPMDHDRVFDEMEKFDVGGGDCTLCGKCVEMCPERGCLAIAAGPRPLVRSHPPRFRGVTGRKLKGGDDE